MPERSIAPDFSNPLWCGAKVWPIWANGTVDKGEGLSTEPVGRVLSVSPAGVPSVYWADTEEILSHDPVNHLTPDFSDSATVGCLIAVLREAWAGKIVIMCGNGWWEIETDTQGWDHDNTTSFVSALVYALLASMQADQ